MSRQERLAGDLAARVSGCPDPETLRRHHEAPPGPGQAASLSQHLRGCGACRAAVEALQSGEPEEEGALPVDLPAGVARELDRLMDEVGRPAAVRRATSIWTTAVRLAAGLVLVGSLSLAGYLWWTARTPSGPEPFGDLGVLRGGGPLELLEPVGALDGAPSTMRWAPHPEAATYLVTLFDESMTKIWTRETGNATPSLELDETASAPLARGGRFTWQVEAVGKLGQPLARSPAAQFQIAAATPTR